MKWPISWSDVKDHIDDIEDGIDPKLLPQGGVGYAEEHKAIYDIRKSGTEIITPLGTFTWVSAEMPTLEEIKKATVTPTFADESNSLSGSIKFYSVLQTSPGVCGTMWVTRDSDGSADWYGIVAVYEVGQHTVTQDGYEIPIEVPQTGLYVSVDDNIHAIIEKNPGLQYTIDIAWESVKTIDPKFLPGVCLPVVELETVPTEEGAMLTEAETTLVKRLLETNDYALVSFIDKVTGFPTTNVCRKRTNEDGVGYFGIIGGSLGLVVLVAQDGTGMVLCGVMG